MALGAIGMMYMGNRVARFGFVEKLFPGNNLRKNFAGFGVVAILFASVTIVLNLVNAVVVLLHFVFIWISSDFIFGMFTRHIRKKPFKKYYSGLVAIFLSLVSLATGWYLDNHVWVTPYTITSDKIAKNFRIVQFADAHIGSTFDGKGFAEQMKKVQALHPDVVVVVGDFVDDDTTREEMIVASQALGELKTPYGVYFVFGNHDKGYADTSIRGFTGDDLIAELKKNKVIVLQDETVLIDNNFYIVGRQDASEFQRGSSRQDMKQLTEALDKNKFSVVLDHQPNDYANQADSRVDLVLSGHTHGGQLFPLNRVGEWIGANDKVYGYERRYLTDFIVTSGISDWTIKFKTGTKSEIVVIDVKQD